MPIDPSELDTIQTPILDQIHALLPSNNAHEIDAQDMRNCFTSTFQDREVTITKLANAADLPTNNTGIYAGSLVAFYNDTTNNGIYLSSIDQPTSISDLKRLADPSHLNVIDNLTSNSAIDALSANQGRILNEAKLDKTGGTITGDLIIDGELDVTGQIVCDDNIHAENIYSRNELTARSIISTGINANGNSAIQFNYMNGLNGVLWYDNAEATLENRFKIDLTTAEEEYIIWHSGNFDPNNLSFSASQVSYNSSNDPVTHYTNLQDAMEDQSWSIEERVSKTTGVKTGGELTKISDTEVEISQGEGTIVDSYSTPQNSSFQNVSWSTLTETINMNSSGFGKTSLMIDSNGLIVQIEGRPTSKELRDHIYLGMVYYDNGVITNTVNAPIMFGMTSTDVTDIFEMNIKTAGLGIEAVQNELQLYMKPGVLFAPGVNYHNDPANPNLYQVAGIGSDTSGAPLVIYNRDFSFRGESTDVPELWDNNGTVEGIPGNDAVIHRLFIAGITDPKLVLLLGQNKYTNTRTAKDNLIIDGTNTVIPDELQEMHFLAWVCVRNGSGDFSDIDRAWIANPIGSSGSSVVSTLSHDQLSGRDLPDQHIPESITGLDDYLWNLISANTHTISGKDVVLDSVDTPIITLDIPQLDPGNYFFSYDLTAEFSDDLKTAIWTDGSVQTLDFRIDARNHLYTPFSYGFPLSWDGDGVGGPADFSTTLYGRKQNDGYDCIIRFADMVVKKYGNL